MLRRNLYPLLQEILNELEQYLIRLATTGFETWEKVLSINEFDLKWLGFKLGHRRKLQRKIEVSTRIYWHVKRRNGVVMTGMDRDGSDHYRLRQAPLPMLRNGQRRILVRHCLLTQLMGLPFHASMIATCMCGGIGAK
jgi:hypothetical protein